MQIRFCRLSCPVRVPSENVSARKNSAAVIGLEHLGRNGNVFLQLRYLYYSFTLSQFADGFHDESFVHPYRPVAGLSVLDGFIGVLLAGLAKHGLATKVLEIVLFHHLVRQIQEVQLLGKALNGLEDFLPSASVTNQALSPLVMV